MSPKGHRFNPLKSQCVFCSLQDWKFSPNPSISGSLSKSFVAHSRCSLEREPRSRIRNSQRETATHEDRKHAACDPRFKPFRWGSAAAAAAPPSCRPCCCWYQSQLGSSASLLLHKLLLGIVAQSVLSPGCTARQCKQCSQANTHTHTGLFRSLLVMKIKTWKTYHYYVVVIQIYTFASVLYLIALMCTHWLDK